MTVSGPLQGAAAPVMAVLAFAAAIAWWRVRPWPVQWPTAALGALSLIVTALYLPHGDGGSYASAWGLLEAAGLLVLIVLLVRRARPLVAAVVGTLTGAAVAALLLRVLPSPVTTDDLMMCSFWALIAAAAAVAGRYLRAQDAARIRAARQAEREQQLALAADLHDFVAHEVTAMLFQAQAAKLLAGSDPSHALTALDRIEKAGQRALASLDRSVHALRQTGAPQYGLTDLHELARQYSAVGPAPVHVHVAAAAEACSGDVAELAYRIVVEALTNVRRHAPDATAVTVDIQPAADDAALRVTVINDTSLGTAHGAPTRRSDPTAPGGTGIARLAERVGARGGTLTAGPTERHSWRLTAVLPAGRAVT
ncbi:sensor histidine kinase [Micromonospora andamanensis]|uniref:histidine kinase n=1 Tax=Micromonospora andamanensis TaxID=1287068 RepID=A0ABQ4I253_9ACTN|nr:histidine kinase [Micromonospora andamanensis]GIJ11971.1 hypothetical protein Van01_51850 [Micromonospora andamanensis]GIJ41132.1 hypothetical protein Vwe01_44570 [Micromonospora andamanensis]